MFKKEPPKINPHKEAIAKHLRTASLHLQQGKYEDANFEVQRALELDPKDYYARSLAERIRVQLEKKERESKASDVALEDRINEIAAILKKADFFIENKQYKLALAEVAHVFAIDSNNYYAKAYSDRIEMLMNQSATAVKAPAAPIPAARPAPAPAPASAPAAPKAPLIMLKELLKEVWFDGKVTEAEAQEILNVRTKFGINEAEYLEVESQVRVEAYVEALRVAWRDGVITKNEEEVLQLMRKRYNITLEEHMSAEARVLWAKISPHAKGSIMIVEDEKSTLLSISFHLKKHGYDAITAENAENALAILQTASPVLIISDLMLGEGKMTGLDLYRKVRENAGTKDIPFLLMSGISDEFVVRAGVRMGVDSFLRKPFDLELLLATIEGKIGAPES